MSDAIKTAMHVQYGLGRPYELPAAFCLVCSASWKFTGPADGVDLWDRWRVVGPGDPKDAFVRPWLNERIIVIGYEMTKLFGPPHGFFMVGSGIQPDAFLWMGANETRTQTMFPAGYGHPWPTAEEAARPGFNNIIDIHGAAGAPVASAPWTPNWRGRLLRKLAPQVSVSPPLPPGQVGLDLTIYYTPWT